MPIEEMRVKHDGAVKLVHRGETDGSVVTIRTRRGLLIAQYIGTTFNGYPALSALRDYLPREVRTPIEAAIQAQINQVVMEYQRAIDWEGDPGIREQLSNEEQSRIATVKVIQPILTRVVIGQAVSLRLPKRFGDAHCISLGTVLGWSILNPT